MKNINWQFTQLKTVKLSFDFDTVFLSESRSETETMQLLKDNSYIEYRIVDRVEYSDKYPVQILIFISLEDKTIYIDSPTSLYIETINEIERVFIPFIGYSGILD